jgi:hypothetical protein
MHSLLTISSIALYAKHHGRGAGLAVYPFWSQVGGHPLDAGAAPGYRYRALIRCAQGCRVGVIGAPGDPGRKHHIVRVADPLPAWPPGAVAAGAEADAVVLTAGKPLVPVPGAPLSAPQPPVSRTRHAAAPSAAAEHATLIAASTVQTPAHHTGPITPARFARDHRLEQRPWSRQLG